MTSRNFNEDDFVQVVEFLDQGVKIALEAQEKTGKTINIEAFDSRVFFEFKSHHLLDPTKYNSNVTKQIKACMFCTPRAETRALIWAGGEYSYLRVLPDEFLLKSVVITNIRVDF